MDDETGEIVGWTPIEEMETVAKYLYEGEEKRDLNCNFISRKRHIPVLLRVSEWF